MYSCEHCGESWDQDETAAKNLLRLRDERLHPVLSSAAAGGQV
jgi:transposase